MDKISVKTFYTYNTRANKQILQAITITIAVSFALLITAVILLFTQNQWFFRILLPLVVAFPALFFLSSFLPAKKELQHIFDNESIVTLDWGLEHYGQNGKKEVKWGQIDDVREVNKNIMFIKHKQYTIVYIEKAKKKNHPSAILDVEGTKKTIDFYSSLEDVDFLLNHINKQRKKVADEKLDASLRPIG